MPLPLTTQRLVIRPLTVADAEDVYAVFSAPGVMRYWNSPPPADLAEAREWSTYLAGMHRDLGFAQWHVSERAGGCLVGIAGLQPLADGPEVEITFALKPAVWGRGLATEAGAAILRFGFAEAGLGEVVGIAKQDNTASLRVLHKLGMRFTGVAEYWHKPWARYELAAGEWRASRALASRPDGPPGTS